MKRRLAALALVVPAAAFAWPGTAASQSVDRIGVANAQATIGAIVPRAGSIPVTVAFGNAAADISGTRTRGRANDTELGLLGSIITGETCGRTVIPPEQLPKAVLAASPEGPPNARRDRLAVPQGPNANAKAFAVEAEAKPEQSFGAADGVRINVPGLVNVTGGRSTAITRNVNGVREAIATADFSTISVGPIRLENVHTEAFNRTGAKTERGTKFSVGAVVIAGVRSEPPSGASPDQVLGPINAVLAPLGLTFNAPKAEFIGNTQFLRPIELVVGKSLLSENVVSPLFAAIQPARDQLDRLAAGVCGAPALLTVTDLGLALASGSGSLALQFGGVDATSGEVEAKNPFGTFTPATPSAPVVTALPSLPGTPAVPGTPPQVRRIAGGSLIRSDDLVARAGRAGLAGLIAVLAIVAFAGRDYLVMRSNSRSLVGGTDV